MIFLLLLLPALAIRAGNATDPSQEPEYRLGPEDVVEIWVWKQPDLSQTVTIRPDGNISLPLIGEVQAGNKTPKELEAALLLKWRVYLVKPVVNVIVKEIKSYKIVVLGKVKKPDSYLVGRNINVLDAIAMAGGLREDSNGNRVVILRSPKNGASLKQRIELDLKRLISDEKSGPIRLQALDTVYVPD